MTVLKRAKFSKSLPPIDLEKIFMELPVQLNRQFFSVFPGGEKMPKCLFRLPLPMKRGIARTRVRRGSKTGEYHVTAEAAAPESGWFLRPVTIRVLAINLYAVLTGVLGGLVFFYLRGNTKQITSDAGIQANVRWMPA